MVIGQHVARCRGRTRFRQVAAIGYASRLHSGCVGRQGRRVVGARDRDGDGVCGPVDGLHLEGLGARLAFAQALDARQAVVDLIGPVTAGVDDEVTQRGSDGHAGPRAELRLPGIGIGDREYPGGCQLPRDHGGVFSDAPRVGAADRGRMIGRGRRIAVASPPATARGGRAQRAQAQQRQPGLQPRGNSACRPVLDLGELKARPVLRVLPPPRNAFTVLQDQVAARPILALNEEVLDDYRAPIQQSQLEVDSLAFEGADLLGPDL
ncbi:hypothetical protein CDEF62S_04807 [Castellaniella defragrans]